MLRDLYRVAYIICWKIDAVARGYYVWRKVKQNKDRYETVMFMHACRVNDFTDNLYFKYDVEPKPNIVYVLRGRYHARRGCI